MGKGNESPALCLSCAADSTCLREHYNTLVWMLHTNGIPVPLNALYYVTVCVLRVCNCVCRESVSCVVCCRQHMAEEYRKQVMAVLAQWDSDVLKSREAEEKMQMLFKQTQKSFQQQRVTQSQRVKTIRQLHEHFSKV